MVLGQVVNYGFRHSTGNILSFAPVGAHMLVNVYNTISGGGIIALSFFDNQFGGIVEASQSGNRRYRVQPSQSLRQSHERRQDDRRSGATLGLSGSMVNSGAIQLQSNSDLAIGANFTITGSGAILAEGANGAENITSDGAAPATFINDSTIIYLGSGQIGNSDLFGATNDLTFDNSGGAVAVSGTGNTLTLNTGSNTITDNALGLLMATNSAQLNIEFPCHNRPS